MKDDPLQTTAKVTRAEQVLKEPVRPFNLPGMGADKLPGILIDNLRAIPSEIFSTIKAEFREGAKDLRNFFLDPMGGGMQVEEAGTPLNPLPLEIYQERHSEEPWQELNPLERFRGRQVEPTQERGIERG